MSEDNIEYFYVDYLKTRVGPIGKTEFSEAVSAGTINDSTPVWRTGDSEWKNYGNAKRAWAEIKTGEAFLDDSGENKISAVLSLKDVFSSSWRIIKTRGFTSAFIVGAIIIWGIEAATGVLINICFDPLSVWYGFASTFHKFFLWWGLALVYSVGCMLLIRKWEAGRSAKISDVFAFLSAFKRLGRVIGGSISLFLVVFFGYVLLFVSWLVVGIVEYPNFKPEYDSLVETSKVLSLEDPNSSGSTDYLESFDEEAVFSNLNQVSNDEQALIKFAGDLIAFLAKVASLPAFWVLLVCSVAFTFFSYFLYIRLMFWYTFILDTKCGVFDSFKYSWAITRGNFWRIVGYDILLGSISLFATVMTLGIAFIFFTPFSKIFMMVIYIKLRKNAKIALPESDAI